MLTLLVGCSTDTLDVDRRAIVDEIALDADGEGGYAVTYGFFDLHAGGGSGGGGGQGATSSSSDGLTFVTEKAPSASQAIADLENTLPGKTFYGAVRIVLIGEDLLAAGAAEPVLAVARLQEIPENTVVTAVKGRASTFVSSPSIASRQPIYFNLTAQSLVNSVLVGERLFNVAGNATTSNLAVMLPVFAVDQGLARFEGASVVVGGRQRSFLPTNAAAVMHPLVAAGPDTVRVSLPAMAPHSLIFRMRRAYADATELADGSVRLNWRGEGRLDERETLAGQGYSDKAMETGIARSILEDLKGAIAALMKDGVDPRQIAYRPVLAKARTVRLVVRVQLDRSMTGP